MAYSAYMKTENMGMKKELPVQQGRVHYILYYDQGVTPKVIQSNNIPSHHHGRPIVLSP